MSVSDVADIIHDIRDPAEVEKKIQEVKNRIFQGVLWVRDREKEARDARREHDHAFALTYKGTEGSDNLRRQTAIADNIGLRETADNMEIALKYAERHLDALSKELFAWQSILNSVRAMFNAVGVRG